MPFCRVSSSFVEFHRVSSRSLFCFSSFAPFEAYKTSFASHLGPHRLLLSSSVLSVTVAGGQVHVLVGWYNLGSFWVELTWVDLFWLSLRQVGSNCSPFEA